MRAALPLLLCAGAVAAPAIAQTTKNFTVAATIANGCAVSTDSTSGGWGNIALGTVTGVAAQQVSANLLSSGTAGIQLACTPGMTVNVSADQGNQASGGIRQLTNGASPASLIPYTLYANGSATPWTTQSIPLAFPVGTSAQSLPVSAQATLSGPTKGGSYADTVRITLAW